jgi:serine/threonine protein kinase
MRARAVGRYELLRELGRGGTATVYLARQKDLGRLVALKELTALPVSDPSTARRFTRESRLAGSLNHPNVVTVHDFFEDNGTPYIAMEYLPRGTLRPLMHELSFAQVAKAIEGLLAGLTYAHERAIVHRDLKPENLMVSDDDRVKIADFGIAKVTDEAHVTTALTVKGTTIGTPTYMAPEQATGGDIGPWTDMYAVGVIAFELLAGRPPFDTSGGPMAILLRHVNEAPLELTAVDPSADPRLSDWIARLLVKDPDRRLQSAAEAWHAFEEIVFDTLGPRWRRTAILPAAAAVPTPATVPPADGLAPTAMPRLAPPRPPARPKRRPGRGGVYAVRRLLLAGALVAVLAAALAAAKGPAVPDGSPRAVPTAARQAPRDNAQPARSSGVGDSRSDDPSDDEPDSEEP